MGASHSARNPTFDGSYFFQEAYFKACHLGLLGLSPGRPWSTNTLQRHPTIDQKLSLLRRPRTARRVLRPPRRLAGAGAGAGGGAVRSVIASLLLATKSPPRTGATRSMKLSTINGDVSAVILVRHEGHSIWKVLERIHHYLAFIIYLIVKLWARIIVSQFLISGVPA
ncbi:unnamed protein product [Nesidiocoris tenuis]|uniref:Uncharacterized protein n=1 Tax=Nesidiocoris tenuis TaxID=355587 RepID=A0A6H5G646_9HEMI|nr:unnamed protein product [Nesidiocoris tenuis]